MTVMNHVRFDAYGFVHTVYSLSGPTTLCLSHCLSACLSVRLWIKQKSMEVQCLRLGMLKRDFLENRISVVENWF